MSKYEQLALVKHYSEIPLLNKYESTISKENEYSYTSDKYLVLREKLNEIITNVNIEKINKINEEIKFLSLTKKQIHNFSINLEKITKGILISFARQKLFEEDSVYFLDELDPYIIGEFCINCKLSFNTYLKYSLLIKRYFIEFISINHIFDKWGFYSISNDRESIELFFHKEYKDNFVKSREIYLNNSKNLIEETDF